MEDVHDSRELRFSEIPKEVEGRTREASVLK